MFSFEFCPEILGAKVEASLGFRLATSFRVIRGRLRQVWKQGRNKLQAFCVLLDFGVLSHIKGCCSYLIFSIIYLNVLFDCVYCFYCDDVWVVSHSRVWVTLSTTMVMCNVWFCGLRIDLAKAINFYHSVFGNLEAKVERSAFQLIQFEAKVDDLTTDYLFWDWMRKCKISLELLWFYLPFWWLVDEVKVESTNCFEKKRKWILFYIRWAIDLEAKVDFIDCRDLRKSIPFVKRKWNLFILYLAKACHDSIY